MPPENVVQRGARWRGQGWTFVVVAMVVAAWANGLSTDEARHLDRGLVVIGHPNGGGVLSWRLLPADPAELAFNVYRDGALVNRQPLTDSTWLHDADAPRDRASHYVLKALDDGHEATVSEASFGPDQAAQPYLSIPLQTPEGYAPNDGSVGDLDGDGALELVLHQTGRSHDNSQSGETDPPILQAYEFDGTLLWSINLGINIREGAHYTQFMVYDLDGDGRAEVACKTADGTVDGQGQGIGDAKADWRSPHGYILEGPEYLTVFDGRTGAALQTVDYLPPRGNVQDWGDNYGNRVDRFLAGVAYLDGERPSLVFCRGYYTRTVLVAWDWRGGRLTRRWTFDSADGTPGNAAYAGQGNHGLSVADVDGDGRDEIIYGACCIDDDGTGLYSTGLGHGDALHVSDLDPNRPGLEVFDIHEHPKHEHGAEFRDARTGEVIWSKPSPDVGRGVALDIDPRYRGAEMWAAGRGLGGIWNAKGEQISDQRPRSINFGIWWDGDPLRELLDSNRIGKWNWTTETDEPLLVAEGCVSNNGTKSTPVLCADILGDWREEVIWRTADNQSLRLYTTWLPTDRRMVTLLADRQYRLAAAWQNVGYNQPPHPSFWMGR